MWLAAGQEGDTLPVMWLAAQDSDSGGSNGGFVQIDVDIPEGSGVAVADFQDFDENRVLSSEQFVEVMKAIIQQGKERNERLLRLQLQQATPATGVFVFHSVTGAGKTCLLRALKELPMEIDDDTGCLMNPTSDNAQGESDDFRIGSTAHKSQTTFPACVPLLLSGDGDEEGEGIRVDLMDTLGTSDSRGPIHEFGASVTFNDLLRHYEKFGIIIVMSQNDILSSRMKAIRDLLSCLTKMYGKDVFSTVPILTVVSQVAGNNKNRARSKIQSHIGDFVQEAINNPESELYPYRDYLQHLIGTDANLAFFYEPEDQVSLRKNADELRAYVTSKLKKFPLEPPPASMIPHVSTDNDAKFMFHMRHIRDDIRAVVTNYCMRLEHNMVEMMGQSEGLEELIAFGKEKKAELQTLLQSVCAEGAADERLPITVDSMELLLVQLTGIFDAPLNVSMTTLERDQIHNWLQLLRAMNKHRPFDEEFSHQLIDASLIHNYIRVLANHNGANDKLQQERETRKKNHQLEQWYYYLVRECWDRARRKQPSINVYARKERFNFKMVLIGYAPWPADITPLPRKLTNVPRVDMFKFYRLITLLCYRRGFFPDAFVNSIYDKQEGQTFFKEYQIKGYKMMGMSLYNKDKDEFEKIDSGPLLQNAKDIVDGIVKDLIKHFDDLFPILQQCFSYQDIADRLGHFPFMGETMDKGPLLSAFVKGKPENGCATLLAIQKALINGWSVFAFDVVAVPAEDKDKSTCLDPMGGYGRIA